jgi:hypothetical protein
VNVCSSPARVFTCSSVPVYTDAWPLGQDVCKLIKQTCRTICPSLRVFLDVEDLVTGSGVKEVDHSRSITVFAMPVYFWKVNCVKELTRAIVRKKPISLLLPDSEVHGEFTGTMIRDIVTDDWVKRWQMEKRVAQWANEWGVQDLRAPTAQDYCDALFSRSLLEWSRLTLFQERTMVLMCQRLLPDEKREIYLQGAVSFTLPQNHQAIKVYCSAHNLGAAELATELNDAFKESARTLRSICKNRISRCTGRVLRRSSESSERRTETLAIFRRSSERKAGHAECTTSHRRSSESKGRHIQFATSPATNVTSTRRSSETKDLLKLVEDIDDGHLMLVYLNALTWSQSPEELAADIENAKGSGMRLQLCHEFPSVLDRGSPREALEFREIMDATPPQLKKWPINLYSQIAVALKGGKLRDVGLAMLASKLVAAHQVQREQAPHNSSSTNVSMPSTSSV